MTGVVNNTGARSGAVGTTVGTPSGGLDGVTTGSGDVTISDGDLIFGAAGNGICLGVTSNTDANTLDDYEEGTFTPGGTNVSGSSNGVYTKIGRFVQCNVYVLSTGDHANTITGLPFTAGGGRHAGGIAFYNTQDGNQNWGAFVDDGSSTIKFYRGSTQKNIGNTAYVYCTITYSV